jgi:uncharacterized protein YjeT (DUF2065 family)
MEREIQLLASVQFLVIGLSHLLQPRAWVRFFHRLREEGHAGVFANGFLSLWFGTLVVSFHNVWSGLPIVLTLIGWAQVIKALVSFVAPARALRGMQRVSEERAWEFRVAGVIALALSGLFGYLAARG